jgi:hypothetical protein
MGLSSLKGNGGYIGLDERGNYLSGTTGNMSVQKYYLGRLGDYISYEGAPNDFCNGNCLFYDDFQTGDFNGGYTGPDNTVESSWVVVNGSQPAPWIVGTGTRNDNGNGDEGGDLVTIPSGTTYAAYPSNNATDNYYDPSNYVHIYFEFHIPAGTTSLTLEFDWLCYGERSTSDTAYTSFDMGYLLFFNPSTFTPQDGVPYAANGTGWERIIGSDTAPDLDGGRFTGDSNSASRSNAVSRTAFVYEKITIDSTEISTGPWCTNCTRALSFSWMSDTSLQDNPSFTVTNIKLSYN